MLSLNRHHKEWNHFVTFLLALCNSLLEMAGIIPSKEVGIRNRIVSFKNTGWIFVACNIFKNKSAPQCYLFLKMEYFLVFFLFLFLNSIWPDGDLWYYNWPEWPEFLIFNRLFRWLFLKPTFNRFFCTMKNLLLRSYLKLYYSWTIQRPTKSK